MLSFLSSAGFSLFANFPEDAGDDGLEGRCIDFEHVYSKLAKLAVLL